jgi:hypothetical protein
MAEKAKQIFGGFATTLGDQTTLWAQRANLEHFPLAADDDASIALLFSERQLEPGPSETDDSKRARLVAWLQQHTEAGDPVGLLLQLYYSDLGTPVLVQQNGLRWEIIDTPNLADIGRVGPLPSWMLKGKHNNANPPIPASTDGKPAIAPMTVPWYALAPGPMDAAGNQFNSRFAIWYLLGQPPASLATAENLARIRRLIAAWKPAKATCTGIYVSTGGVWDDGIGHWDDGIGVWDDGTFTFYSAT